MQSQQAHDSQATPFLKLNSDRRPFRTTYSLLSDQLRSAGTIPPCMMTDADNGMPYIKHEPDENNLNPNHYVMASQGFSGPQQQFGDQFNNHQLNDGIDPLELQNGNFGMQYSFGSQQNLSSSFNLGNSGIGDDELLDLDLNGHHPQMNDFNNIHNNHVSGQYPDQRHHTGISLSHQGQMTNVYSSTPDGPPIQSPFLGNFNYDQFRPVNGISQQVNNQPSAQFQQNHTKRPSVQSMDRRTSEQRSPLTPRTPAISALHIATPESGSYPSNPIRAGSSNDRYRKAQSGQWDATPNSLHSFVDSPISSPGHPSHHTNISEIIRSGKHASLPAKVENNHGQGMESLDAKKKRRRASHNAVERRRRDNINERIQDLSHLVPQHRLDDDKIRKQIVNNTPMSPTTGATSISPPNAATSLLAGAAGRRAASTAGNITLGLPIEEKEKGPNKGDILNGSVSWTRDLMWALYNKYMQEDELQERFRQLNVDWPFESTEDERRMRSELIDAMEKNDPGSFSYTRTNGTGLRVPRHTTMAGEALQAAGTLSPQSLSPPFHSEGSGTNSAVGIPGQPQYWNNAGHPGISFKEEDEYSMEMN
jgi:Helix-loop-helix DNA-binding domain